MKLSFWIDGLNGRVAGMRWNADGAIDAARIAGGYALICKPRQAAPRERLVIPRSLTWKTISQKTINGRKSEIKGAEGKSPVRQEEWFIRDDGLNYSK
jgi:hypothetical protein